VLSHVSSQFNANINRMTDWKENVDCYTINKKRVKSQLSG